MERQIIIVCAAVILSACQTSRPIQKPTLTPTKTPVLVVNDTQTPGPTLKAYSEIDSAYSLWEQSAHANTYDLSKGPNTYCARCHSPRNWNPLSQIDNPPNCVSCKLLSEDMPRTATGNPLVSPEAWKNVGCDICHPGGDDEKSGEIAWWNQATQNYEQVADSNALCEKCHVDTKALVHRVDLGDELHKNFTCITCHDPHSTVASCTSAGCHAEIVQRSDFPPATPVGLHTNGSNAFCDSSNCHPAATAVAIQPRPVHGFIHSAVSCVACHASGEVRVGPVPEGGSWVTWRTLDLYGVVLEQPYASHTLQAEVDCDRCHNGNNSWGLPLVSVDELMK